MSSMWRFGGLGFRELVRRLWRRFWEDRILDEAAMLSFYFLLSIFPLLLFFLALFGLVLQSGEALHHAIEKYLTKVAPASASGLITRTLDQIGRGSSGGTLSFGIVFSLWVASSGVVALMDALTVAYHAQETRPWWKQHLIALGLTIGSVLFMAAALFLLGYGGHLAVLIGGRFVANSGLIMTAWRVAQWMLVVGFLLMAFNLLYIFAPNVKHQGWHWLMPGTVLAVLLWVLVSYGLKLYLSFYNRYNYTYGSIAGVIILLLWFYLTGIAILLGGELNSEIEKGARGMEPPL
jgi:membrane protein